MISKEFQPIFKNITKKKSQFITFVKISSSRKKKQHLMLLQIILRIETEIGREKNS